MKPTRFQFRSNVSNTCLIVLALTSPIIHAAAPNWNTAVSGNWTDTALWSTAAVPVAGDTVTFNAAAQNGPELIYLNGNQAAASVTFANTGSTGLLGGISGTPANNTLALTAGMIQNTGAGAVILGDPSGSPTAKVDLILSGNQSIDGRSTAGTLTIANSVSGAGVVLTTNGGGGGVIAAANTVFKGTVTLGSLVAQGNNGTNGTYQIIRTTTFDGATLGTTGNVSVGRSNIVFTGATTATIGGNIVTSASWGSVTIQGSANVTATNLDMKVGDNATGQLNLFGGTLTTAGIVALDRQAGGDNGAAVTFNGTQMIASQANNSFLTITNGAGGSSSAYIATGGALLNSNGFNIGIASTLKDLTASQVTAGIGKGGIGVTTATTGAGFLTKSGGGTLTLSGTDTYTGATNVNGGNLVVGGSGSINSTSGINVNGSGAKYVHVSSAASTRTITLTQGSVDGTGFLGPVNVGAATGGIVTNGTTSSNGTLSAGTTTLTVDSLNFSGAATVSANVATAGTPGLAVTGALTTTGAAVIAVNAAITGGSWSNGTVYHLIDYGSLGGAGAAAFTLGSVSNLGARQSATLTNSGFIGLSIAGDVPKWTGLKNSNWTTTAQGSPFNWKLVTAGTGTEFQANDLVLFDDTAAGSGTVNVTIPTANVSIAGVTFNNSSSRNYSITGSFGITGGGSLVKNGSGIATLGTVNSYTGGTFVSNGSLALTGSGTLGATTGTLTLNGGTLKLGGTSQTVGNVILFPALIGNSIENGTLIGSAYSSTFDDGSAIVTAALSGTGALTQSGLGTLVLAGANSYTGATQVTDGILEVSGSLNGSNLTVSATGVFNLSGSTTGSNITVSGSGFAFNQTSTGAIAGAGNTFTANSGTTTVEGNNTYTGNTTLNGGFLLVANNSPLGSGTLIYNGGLLAATVANATLANPITLAAGTTVGDGNILTLNGNITKATGGSSFFGGFGTTIISGTNTYNYDAGDTHFILTGGTSLTIAGTTTITASANSAGAVRCFNGSSLTVATGGNLNVVGTTHAIKGDTIIGHLSSSTLEVAGGNLNYSANSGFFLGNAGVGQGTLTISSGTATFLAGPLGTTSASPFILCGRQGATGTINLNGGILATDRTFGRNGGNTSNSGTAAFNFNGGTLKALAANSDWLNSTTLTNVVNNGGTANANNVYPMSSTTVTTGGAIIDSNGFDIAINTVLAHDVALDVTPDGGLAKNGAGTLTLGGASTYTGPTVVNTGILRVNGSLDPASAVTVGTGTRLEGTGTAAGAVTAAGTIAPGSGGVGTLSTGSTTLTGTLATELSGANGDQLKVAGDLNITGATLTFTQLSAPTGGKYVVAKYTGTLTGTFSTSTVPSGYTLAYDATAKEISISKPGFAAFMDGFPGLSAGEKTAAADPDNDGISNLVEYALAGFDPTVANGSPGSLSGLLLTFNKRALAVANGDLQYKIEESATLLAGSWLEVAATESSSAISYTLPSGSPQRFARLKVTQIAP